MNAILIARRGCEKFVAIASAGQPVVLLAIRLFWGWQFFMTGKGKLMNLERTTAFFHDLGIPAPAFTALMAGTTECVGGLFLLVGLASRLTAIPLIITMIVAYITADSDAVKGIYSDPEAFVSAAPFLFLFAAIIILVFGPGFFSIDRIIACKLAKKSPPMTNL